MQAGADPKIAAFTIEGKPGAAVQGRQAAGTPGGVQVELGCGV